MSSDRNTTRVAMIATSDLRLCPIQLRPVRKQTLEYRQLRDSIQENGILQSLTCRERDGIIEVCLGMHRYNCAVDLRVEEVPCIIRDMDDAQVQRLQIAENLHRIPTEPVEYARRLWKIVNVERTMKLPELASELQLTLRKTKELLKIAQLCPEAETALAENQLSLRMAVELASLPHNEQSRLLGITGGIDSRDVIELVRREARHFRQDAKNTRVRRRMQDTYDVQPIFRTRQELLDELENPTMMAQVYEACGATTPTEHWKACLSFALQVDPATYERRKKNLMEKRNNG